MNTEANPSFSRDHNFPLEDLITIEHRNNKIHNIAKRFVLLKAMSGTSLKLLLHTNVIIFGLYGTKHLLNSWDSPGHVRFDKIGFISTKIVCQANSMHSVSK